MASPPRTLRKPTAGELRELALLEALEDVARRIGVEVIQDHLKIEGLRSRGGGCRLKERRFVLLDRKLAPSDKVDLLATELSRLPLDDVFIPASVRHLIRRPADDDGTDGSLRAAAASGSSTASGDRAPP